MKAVVYSKPDCPYCSKAKDFLVGFGVDYQEWSVGPDIEFSKVQDMVREDNGRSVTTVPQIWVNGKYVGGYDDLVEWSHAI